MQASRPLQRLSFGAGAVQQGLRTLPEEVAVALSFNGTTQAVMMATPDDLIDFAYGFALTEGIATPDEVDTVDVVETANGLDVQVWLKSEAEARLSKRRRTMAGPIGCGLCGIDSLDEAMRKMRPIPKSSFTMRPDEVMQAIATLPGAQPLHDATRAV
ncbi:MAG: formate dehydrogenase accessory sulfurtransferase FdhD, partial [Paracoccaceae bacterium]